MKCKNCEFEYQDNYEFCPNCGAPKVAEQPVTQQPVAEQPQMVEAVSLNPAADRVMAILKDKAFLALCILMTVSCVLSLSGGLPLISILITVFLWLTYADSQKGFANEKHLQCVSGTVYASYVITNVASIILIVCGVLFGLLMAVFSGTEEFAAGFNEALSMYDFGEFAFSYEDIPQALMGFVGVLMGVAFLLMGAIMLVINILGIKKIHRFVKSVYMGIMFQNPDFENVRTAKNWLMFFGVCSAIGAVFSAFSEPVTAIAAGCEAAATIIASILIDKHLIEKQQYV